MDNQFGEKTIDDLIDEGGAISTPHAPLEPATQKRVVITPPPMFPKTGTKIVQHASEPPKKGGNFEKIILVATLILLVLAGIAFSAYYFEFFPFSSKQAMVNGNQNNQPIATVCTTEARICPDGSTVVRVAPDCKFAECSEVPVIAYECFQDDECEIRNVDTKRTCQFYSEPDSAEDIDSDDPADDLYICGCVESACGWKFDDSILDNDEDGLTAVEEDLYGTDPVNPDTDGDGYLDGSEVKNGYNPLGEGVLEDILLPVTLSCDFIIDNSFISVETFNDGYSDEGPIEVYRSLRFTDTEVTREYTDVVEIGTYTCNREEKNIVATFANGEISASYDETSQHITWDGDLYQLLLGQ